MVVEAAALGFRVSRVGEVIWPAAKKEGRGWGRPNGSASDGGEMAPKRCQLARAGPPLDGG